MVRDEVDRGTAGRAVRAWLAKGVRKEPALKREARPEESFLAWFPFVRARLDVVGWVLGVRHKRVKRGKRWVRVDVPVETQVEQTVDRTYPASAMAEFGVHRVHLGGDRVEPFDDEVLRGRGMVFRPNQSLEEIGSKLSDRALEKISAGAGLDRVTFSWLAAVRRRVTLVYYPLWVFRYGFRGRTYQVLVDAEDGSVAYGKAPGNHLYRAASLVSACAGTCFLATTALQHLDWIPRSEGGLVALGAIGIALLAVVRWGYREFRHGGVVEEGTGMADEEGTESLTVTVKNLLGDLE